MRSSPFHSSVILCSHDSIVSSLCTLALVSVQCLQVGSCLSMECWCSEFKNGIDYHRFFSIVHTFWTFLNITLSCPQQSGTVLTCLLLRNGGRATSLHWHSEPPHRSKPVARTVFRETRSGSPAFQLPGTKGDATWRNWRPVPTLHPVARCLPCKAKSDFAVRLPTNYKSLPLATHHIFNKLVVDSLSRTLAILA